MTAGGSRRPQRVLHRRALVRSGDGDLVVITESRGKRELARQFRRVLFERKVLHTAKVSPSVRPIQGAAATDILKDTYRVAFLNLPDTQSESDRHRGPLVRLKAILVELGRDYCFAGTEDPVQVGG